MHIRRIEVRNIRGLKQIDMRFDEPNGAGKLAGWNVIAGRNGAGKSTLLKAIAMALIGPARTRSFFDSFANWIRDGESTAFVDIEVIRDKDDDGFAQKGRQPNELTCRLEWGQQIGEDLEPNFRTPENEGPKTGANRGPWAENSKGWFVVGYGPFRRLSGHASDAQRLMVGKNPVSRMVSLFREDASLVECVQWLRDLHLRRLENRGETSERADRLLKSAFELLNAGLLPSGMEILDVDSDGLRVRHHDVELRLDELSDGYRTAIALVLDILRHLANCYGHDSLANLYDRSGVVLIDEADVHLHVSWQQRLGFWLKERFPNLQFIVATHSPFIAQAADPYSLFCLPAPGTDDAVRMLPPEQQLKVINGTIDDAILTELFGLETPYSPAAQKLREQIGELESKIIRRQATDADKRRLKELKDQLPQSLSADVAEALRDLKLGSAR